MQQAVDAAEIDEGAVVSQVLDLSFDDDLFLDVVQCLIFSAGVLEFRSLPCARALHLSACD